MSNLYKIGGALPLDAPSYIQRHADQDLYEGLLASEFCYVLNSRQMGKSSLRVQTMRRLQEVGVACGTIDITKVGSQGITPEEWYAGVLFTLTNQLQLPLTLPQFEDWWEEHRLFSPVNRFSEFIDGVLLKEVSVRIVIFIDEIDSVLQLNFKDDFFAAIRACYNKRSENPDYDRLTFALLGVATPSNLIQDKNRTPFNIGRAVQLSGFQFEEARPLAQGLANKAVNPEAVLQEILHWTGGQPFLTQKLCHLVLALNGLIPEGEESTQIEQLVKSRIIENWESQDEPEHLRTIRDRLLKDEQRKGQLVGLHQQILQFGQVRADASFEQIELRLAGLVVEQQAQLRVYNRIYQTIFNQLWVDDTLANLRPYAETIRAWLNSNNQDESRLLRGQALQDALAWASGKRLSWQDYQFLSASQRLEKREVEKELEVEREANQISSEAQRRAELALREEQQATQRLVEAQTRTAQIIRRGRVVRILTFLVAGLMGALVVRAFVEAKEQTRLTAIAKSQAETAISQAETAMSQAKGAKSQAEAAKSQAVKYRQDATSAKEQAKEAEQEKKDANRKVAEAKQEEWQANNEVRYSRVKLTEARLGTEFERKGADVLRQFEFGSEQLDSLLLAMEVGQNLQSIVQDGRPYQNYPALSPISALQTILDRIIQRNQFDANQGRITALTFSPNGQGFVTASGNGAIKIWHLPGQELAQEKRHQSTINAVSFEPRGGKYFATLDQLGIIQLWSGSGKPIKQWNTQHGRGTSVKFRPDGQVIATTGEDGKVRLWDLSGELIREWDSQQGAITCLSFSSSGKVLATAGYHGKVSLWQLSDKVVKTWDSGHGRVWGIDFSPLDSQRIATTGEDGKIRLWNLSGELIKEWDSQQQFVNYLSFSSDGKSFVTVGRSGSIRFWNLSGKLLKEFKGNAGETIIALSQVGQRFMTSGSSGRVQMWELSEKVNEQQFSQESGIKDISLSPSGQYLVSAGADGLVYFWNLSESQSKQTKWDSQQNQVNFISFNPSSQNFVTAGEDDTVRLWNLSGELQARWGTKHKGITSISYSPDGKHVATTGKDGQIRIWDLLGKQWKEWNTEHGLPTSISFSSNGRYIATAGQDGRIRMWNLLGTKLQDWDSKQGPVWKVSFSPDNQYVVTAGEDKTARIWRFSGRHTSIQLRGHTRAIYDVGISPDGSEIVTAGQDGTIRFWDPSGRQITQLVTTQGIEYKLSFSTLGQRFAIAGVGEEKIRVRRIEGLNDLLKQGCNWLQDYSKTHPTSYINLKICRRNIN